ncbi:hypothetical protein P7K49_015453 [Saguinus oedipus]|uniref:Uncharacterized protein n=1 Tax=Saguinus oedipus TaxID=9490 RepID=A0ABQ9VAK0_SAGOE|nr:hypothetical protein P7K49_015453 [Saguinus oedipus]
MALSMDCRAAPNLTRFIRPGLAGFCIGETYRLAFRVTNSSDKQGDKLRPKDQAVEDAAWDTLSRSASQPCSQPAPYPMFPEAQELPHNI